MFKQYQRKLAVVGAGYWGKNLVRNYFELNALHTICDSRTELFDKILKQYPGVTTTTKYEQVLNNPEIERIVIALPAESHFIHAEAALNAGKHVFVEKPLALQYKQAESLLKLASDKKLTLMVGHLMQYHPAFQELQKKVRAGELGKILYIYSNRLSFGKIRREENILWSFAPHDISMILSLCQELPSQVSATGSIFLQHNIADVTITHLGFPSGVKAHIFVSWLHPFKEQKLIVVGEKKMAVFSDTEEWDSKLLLYSHNIGWVNGRPIPQKAEPERIIVERSEPLKNECMHFLDCVQDGKEPITDGSEGLKVLKVLELAQESLEKTGSR
jgi:predicted dehydrogenase